MINLGEPRSVREVVHDGATALRESGVEAPRREAVRMWRDLFDVTLAQLVADHDAPVATERQLRYEAAVRERRSGSPLAYVTGKTGFRHLTLSVDHRVLIPRPETEGLVEMVLRFTETLADQRRALTCLDLGTGSGCIALSLATEGRFSRLVATDISHKVLEVARANAQRVEHDTALEFRLGAFYEPVANEQFDVIVSNPPYIAASEFDGLDSSVRDHEPPGALVSDEAGMFHVRTICTGAPRHLRPGGILMLEVDARRAAASRDHAVAAGLQDVTVYADIFGRPRYLFGSTPHPA